MEATGKCNKAPNANSGGNNANNTNTKYLDHVYCNTGQTKSAYSGVPAPNPTPNSDVLALLKENKQLKAMLILHLDLIQEQSDQLMAKDKALITQNEELEKLRTRNHDLESHVQDLQKQLQRQIKRSGEVSTLPPPPLAKIQCKSSLNVASIAQSANVSKSTSSGGMIGVSNIIGECNGKVISKIVLQRVPSARGKHRTQSPQSQTTDSEHEEDEYDEEQEQYDEIEVENDEDEEDEDEEEIDEDQDQHSIHEHEDNIEIIQTQSNNSNNQQTLLDDLYDTGNSTEDSNEVLAVQSKRLRLKQAAKQSLALPRGAKPSVSPASTTTNDGKTTFKAVTTASSTHLSVPAAPTLSRGKQMTIMRWHAPDYHTDESVSCDSNAETEKRSTSVASGSPPKPSANTMEKKRYHHTHDIQHPHHSRQKIRKCTYISTPQLYSTREWEDEAFNCDNDFDFFKSEAKNVKASDAPKLEIPKWTEHELTPSYCIEGTEDLSDDIFLKRHAKLEVDEKRRKKWDVQQIREQRRIERLKRRHCKDEIQHAQESTSVQSFYPTTENIQTICFVNDLPVQAFGEMIPRIAAGTNGERKDFLLPWLDTVHIQNTKDNNKKPTVTTVSSVMRDTTTSLQNHHHQMLNSSFVFLKKRKRQSSLYGPHHTSRQRSLAAAKLAVAAPPIPQSTTVPVSTITTSTSSPLVTTCNTPTLVTPTTTSTSTTTITGTSISNVKT